MIDMHIQELVCQAKKVKVKDMVFNINVHLPCGTEDDKILSVFNKILIPKANLFKPDFI